jgi:hypothetical protein
MAEKAKVVTTHGAVVVTMDHGEMQKMMDKCIRETGKVKFGIQDVSVTKLGEISEASVIVN